MINHKHKFIFIHVPKTGGCSVRRALNGGGLRHRTLDCYNQQLVQDYFTFAFVRNPYDLLVSWYHHKPALEQVYRSFENWVKHRCPSHTESEIMNNRPVMAHSRQSRDCVMIDGATWDTHQHLMQHKWTRSISMNNHGVDFVGRFESLQQDLDRACELMNLPARQLPHINNSKHKHYTEYYNNQTRRLVAEQYAEDLKCFNYTYGDV